MYEGGNLTRPLNWSAHLTAFEAAENGLGKCEKDVPEGLKPFTARLNLRPSSDARILPWACFGSTVPAEEGQSVWRMWTRRLTLCWDGKMQTLAGP